MKASQKLIVKIENIKLTVRFDEIDSKLLPLVKKLETEGDKFGPVVTVIESVCVTMQYADKSRGPVKPKIFGYDCDELMAKQH